VEDELMFIAKYPQIAKKLLTLTPSTTNAPGNIRGRLLNRPFLFYEDRRIDPNYRGSLPPPYRAYGPQHWWPAVTPFEVIVGAILTQSAAWSNVEKAIRNLKRPGP
jgi:hypothetical protein